MDLRYPRPAALSYSYKIAAVWHDGTPIDPRGALVLPGQYTVSLKVGGKEYTQPLSVKLDPRVHVQPEALRQQLELAQTISALLNKVVATYHAADQMLKTKKKNGAPEADIHSLTTLTTKGKPSLASVAGVLANLVNVVQMADAAPTQGQRAAFAHYKKQFNGLLQQWEKMKSI